MTTPAWTEPPHLPLLQWLVRGPVKQNLAQAIRLWVWIRLLYGDEQHRITLPESFTYADCRSTIFTESHPTGDDNPGDHDATCPCQKSLAAWLVSPTLTCVDGQHFGKETVEQWQLAMTQARLSIEETETLLVKCQPFAVTRKTLSNDLKRLCELGWLAKSRTKYRTVAEWPHHPSLPASAEITFLQQPDLALIAANLSEEIGGQQRFFVHTDYVISRADTDRVEDWQVALQQLWQEAPVLPAQLHYWSASRLEHYRVVVYPVCIYYYRRGPYLCGWGQVPGEPNTMSWRNYRLDRIQQLTPISWQSDKVPPELLSRFQREQLPISTEIEKRMDEAWGFDYYQEARSLLVRFDAEWDERYIRNSIRHSTFKRVGYGEARSLIQSSLSGQQQQTMLNRLGQCEPTDAYYRAIYRHDDPNVRQRLRAWRPHIEVLLPWSLRSRFAYEVNKEQEFYKE